MKEIKKQAFEFLLTQLLQWAKETKPIVPIESFTRLKALKLLFFVAVIRDDKNTDLLDIFDNFYAMPNGPVESDIYNCITSDSLDFYTFRDFSFHITTEYRESVLSNDIKQRIITSVECLKKQNYAVISYNAEKLVQLSHEWISWQNSIQIAHLLGRGSYPMNVKKIRNDQQIFL